MGVADMSAETRYNLFTLALIAAAVAAVVLAPR